MRIQTPMAQGRSTILNSMIKWIQLSRLPIKESLSPCAQPPHQTHAPSPSAPDTPTLSLSLSLSLSFSLSLPLGLGLSLSLALSRSLSLSCALSRPAPSCTPPHFAGTYAPWCPCGKRPLWRWGFRVSGDVIRVSGFGVRGLGFWFWVSGFWLPQERLGHFQFGKLG